MWRKLVAEFHSSVLDQQELTCVLSPVSNLIRDDVRRGVRVMQVAGAAPGNTDNI